MKKLFVTCMVALSAMAMVAADAEAKRMGGGGSIGRQSQSASRSAPMATPNQSVAPAQSQAARPQAPAPAPAVKPPSPWRNILGGALLGLGLGALLSHFGLGGAMANVIGTLLMFGLLFFGVMMLMRLFRRKNGYEEPRPSYAGYGADAPAARTPEIGSRLEPTQATAFQVEAPVAGGAAAGAAPYGVPADFDAASFLRHAKTYFIRLQAAWDRGDINDIREFTTPEMFAELRLQLQERGATPNHTDVVSLDAQLLGMETAGADHLASVRFSGMIREAENATAEPFTEIWNLTKPVAGQGGWVLAGIQQVASA
ncbi:Predicted lipid-binding transport protein, Tim44 family [Noviherbaspirillum humi]|uniref:Predicted lipid-binding transport protein, Tim44 family n=1 Tax=Noviherbaspirillum humi TaxID=1688639 RepID=A0A239CLI0_9BURK|nr:Tim44-like domain-containing protein [Noviherbaspirillum humi]SNS21007.1 Predicted lipid-binding transport protein, Tim44 family [Noviherbaspirillum humi]